MHHITANFQAAPDGVRRDLFEGRAHIVVPVVMIVDGVLNDALVTQAEYGKFPDAWNGIPVPVGHPQENGGYVSACRPDIIERSLGVVFNARCDDGKLKAEMWIDEGKAQRADHGDLLNAMESGALLEVSTGYFADDDPTPGEFNGASYSVVHRNIRPDHLALLPGEIGACSVADGCGTRVNTRKRVMTTVNEAVATLARALGLKQNCACEDQMPDILEQADALVKSNALDAKQLAAIQGMSPADRDVMAAFIAALGAAPTTPEEPEDMADTPEKPEDMPSVNAEQIEAVIANRVDAAIRRRDVVARLTANADNPLTDADMQAASVEMLERIEAAIRPADYSGAGGFAANSDVIDANVTPLGIPGLMNRKEA